MVSRAVPKFTYAEYAALERVSAEKHEFYDGVIFSMAGGSADHAALAAQVIMALAAAAGDGPCRVFTSDMRIYIEAFGMATFPDVSVVCGSFEQHTASPEATALNPAVIAEVTSESTEAYDLTTKLDAYLSIPTLMEYVIVSHRERRITVYRRTAGGWTNRVGTTGGAVGVETLGAQLVVDTIYRGSAIT